MYNKVRINVSGIIHVGQITVEQMLRERVCVEQIT
jgi:hypothetical protein